MEENQVIESEEVVEPIEPAEPVNTDTQETVETSNDLPTDKPVSAGVKSFLDGLSEGGETTEAAETTEAKDDAEEKPAEPIESEAKVDPKTPDQEDAEILDGIKSERGKERIKQVLAERKQLESDITEIRTLINDTKMTPDQFAQTLEFGRLMNSGNEKDLRVAYEMVEQQRAVLAQALGLKAPGIDLLAGHDDLKKSVENMEITEDTAIELARYRKSEADRKAQALQTQESQQSIAQFQQETRSAEQAMVSYLDTRKNEIDHPARMNIIAAHFKNPQNVQEFVSQFQPHQWTTAMKLMYDSIVVPKQAPSPQPLRSRPATLGIPSGVQGDTPADRISSRIDSLGI